MRARARRAGPARRLRAATRARPRLRGGLLALACLLAGGGALASSDLAIRDVAVRGAVRLEAQFIRANAGLAGQNAFRASAAAAAARLRAIPAVRDARVGIELPDRAVVEVVERTPAIVVSSGGARLYADDEGRLFAAGGEATGLPQLDDETAARANGDRLDRQLVSATRTLGALQGGFFGQTVRRVRLTERFAIVAVLASGTEIRIGGAERLAAKLETARRIVLARAGRRLDYVDVRTPDATFFPLD